MKAIISFSILLLCFSLKSVSQTADGKYSRGQHPLLLRLKTGDKNLIPFYSKDTTAFIMLSVIDKLQNKIFWFDSYGYYFDAVPISKQNIESINQKKITAFKYYDFITSEYIKTINKARNNLQTNGNSAKFTTYEKQLLQIDDTVYFPSTLKKLIELDKQKLSVERQIREFHSPNPKYIIEDTAIAKTLNSNYGSMETRYESDTTTTYYNRTALQPVYKAVLNHQSATISYYNRRDELVDKLQVNKNNLDVLFKDKTDVFLLYRGWLEIQRFNIVENIGKINISISEFNKTQQAITASQYINTSGTFQSLINYSTQLLKITDSKIDYLTTIDRGFISQCLRAQYISSSNTTSVTDGISTLIRGNKFYELSDARGNVMAVVTDKKIQHSSNGTTVDYYEPDIVSATDYAPFGSPLSGRNYQSDIYRYGYNGKENDNEVKGKGNQIDYGMRIYDPRLGRFLSVDPLTKSYPHYTPYSYAGNKPIVAVDLDGLEEKIIIYSETKDGRVKIETTNGLTLRHTVQISGQYAMGEPITAEQWRNYKKAIFDGYSILRDNFVNGYEDYTSGMAGTDNKDFSGYNHGTLSIGAGRNYTTLGFDPTPNRGNPTTSESVNMGWKGFKAYFIKPDPLIEGSAEFKNTIDNVAAAASLIIGVGELTEGVTLLKSLGVASSADDLTKLTKNIKNDKVRNLVEHMKLAVSIVNLKDGKSILSGKTDAAKKIPTAIGTAAESKAVIEFLIKDIQDIKKELTKDKDKKSTSE